MSAAIIVDADAHVSIPENLFAERFPESLRGRSPKRLTIDGDKFFWLVEGRMVPKPSGRGPGTARGFTPRGAPKDHYLNNIAGRLVDMDQVGRRRPSALSGSRHGRSRNSRPRARDHHGARLQRLRF